MTAEKTHKTPERVRAVLQDMVREMGSINKVVKRTGITHNTIGTWLEGRSEPEQESLEKLSAACGRTVAWLRGDTDQADAADDLTSVIASLSPVQRKMLDYSRTLSDEQVEALLAVAKQFLKEHQ